MTQKPAPASRSFRQVAQRNGEPAYANPPQRKVAKIKLVITRKPESPPLPSFVCVVCERETERDPYHPEWERAPICTQCNWRSCNRLQTRQLPHQYWADFRRFYSVVAALEKEAHRARRTY